MKSIICYLLICICATNSSLLLSMQQPHKLLAIDETTPEVAGLILFYADPADAGYAKYIFGQYNIKLGDKDSVIYSALIERPYTSNAAKQFQDILVAHRIPAIVQSTFPSNVMKEDEPAFTGLSTAPGNEKPIDYSFIVEDATGAEKEIKKKYYLYVAEIDFTIAKVSKNVDPVVNGMMQSLGLAPDQYVKKTLSFLNTISRLQFNNQIVESMGTSWKMFSKNLQFPMARGLGESFIGYRNSGRLGFSVRGYTPEQSPLEGLVKGRPGERILKPSTPQSQQQPNTLTPESELIRSIFGLPTEGKKTQEAPEGEQGGSIFEAFFSKQPAQPAAQPATPPAPAKVKVQTPAPQVPTQAPAPVAQPSATQATAPKTGFFAWLFGRSTKSIDGSLNDLTTALNDLKDAIAKL